MLPEDRGTMKPKAYEFGNNDFYGIETPQVVRTFTRGRAEFIRGGQPYASNNGNYPFSVNPDGSIRDYAALSAKLATVAKRGENGKLRDVGPGTQKGDNYGREAETAII